MEPKTTVLEAVHEILEAEMDRRDPDSALLQAGLEALPQTDLTGAALLLAAGVLLSEPREPERYDR